MTLATRWYEKGWELLYRLNPAWLGGCRGGVLTPYLASARFKNVAGASE